MGLRSDAQVREIDIATARPFICRWHYSRRVPTGANIFFGWFRLGGADADLFGDSLYAVANYGIGVNPYQARFLSQQLEQEVCDSNLVELKRLCRVEPRDDDMPLTAFLARCHRALRSRGIGYVVAFSDPAQGHTGGIYRAANFVHMGTTNAEWHVSVADDGVRHRRFPFRYARRHGITVAEAREELGARRVQTPPKDRWLLCIR